MRVHAMARVAEDDRWVWECTCGRRLGYKDDEAETVWYEHLSEELTPDPLDELALIEAKQRHPSRRRREWLSDDQVHGQ